MMLKEKNAHRNLQMGKRVIMGNSAVPKWNFHKILINKDGKIHEIHLRSFIDPMSKKIIK